MRSAVLASAILGLAALPGAALADSLGRPCTDKPESAYLGIEALKAKVVEQGYQIRSGEIRKSCGEFYVLDKNGKRAELFVDPTTGKIVAGDGKGETGTTGERDDGKAAMSGPVGEQDGADKDGDD
jgi:hypothetical protein